MDDETIYYPLAEVKVTAAGSHNAVLVSISYVKEKGLMVHYLLVQTKNGKDFDSVGFAMFADESRWHKVEDMKRDSKKKVQQEIAAAKVQFALRGGQYWDWLKAFAEQHGLKLAASPSAEPPKLEQLV